jgi:hypothetical protein
MNVGLRATLSLFLCLLLNLATVRSNSVNINIGITVSEKHIAKAVFVNIAVQSSKVDLHISPC